MTIHFVKIMTEERVFTVQQDQVPPEGDIILRENGEKYLACGSSWAYTKEDKLLNVIVYVEEIS